MSLTKTTDQNQRLGVLLVQAGLLTQSQMEQALLRMQTEKQGSLLTVLVDMGIMTFATISKFVEKALGMKTFIIGNRKIDQTVIDMIGAQRIIKDWIFPIGLKESAGSKILYLGLVDPLSAGRLAQLEAEISQSIYPVLISKPDYFMALENHGLKSIEAIPPIPPSATTTLALPTQQQLPPETLHSQGSDTSSSSRPPVRPIPSRPSQSESISEIDISPRNGNESDNLVIIRPGGYEEEIEFEQKRQATRGSSTRTESHTKPNKPIEQGADITGFSPAADADGISHSAYLGEGQKRYREEVLAKLDMDDRESKLIQKESYTRELLSRELVEVSTRITLSAYESLPPSLKIEALINTLIDKGILTKRDVYVQGATSFVFSSLTDKADKTEI